MEKITTVSTGSKQEETYSDSIHPIPAGGIIERTARIKKIQTTAMILLFFAAVINFLDRSSLSVANSTIREEMGLSGTEIGLLLSAFSLAYGIAQLPCGPLLDRKGPRIMLGLGMFIWSLFQTMSGMIHNFTQFIWVRIGLGIGEAPMNPCGVKVINDWFNIKDRGMPMGIFNSASTIGLAISPPILTAMMLLLGWRGMFITIGLLGIALSIGWYLLYRNREEINLSAQEQSYLNAGSVSARREPMNFKEWRSLFRNRTMWGMMIGFSGINYTAWLYLAWLPGYLQTTYHLDLKSTGLLAAIPFLFGAAGMLSNGFVTDFLVRRGMAPLKSRKICIVAGMLLSAAFTSVVAQATTTTSAVALISMALFCIHFAGTSCWGLIHVAVTSRMTASVGSIQNFASFVFASFAPVITGWILDTTHSFSLALTICSCVTLIGALSYVFIVKHPITDNAA
ncbi:sugar phosphate permease [Serratia fonticola]|jgi:sugar phosphate permease|uniref:Sugar phosphate permease n=1 Tax=Serratia fonticola TaxID=47917 RepID=A0A559SZV3_SERFO|nr:MFS transporter [Serratia fonticola]TQI79619.1 sugar phosphate permease [Serratia fonticola]TQI98355.1 sugar phosphate permease [Serratia fonticola]TVZ67883.1 sugar phosphate permease [Serratia fonticola]